MPIASPMIKEQRKRGVTWKDFDDGHEQCRLQLRSVSRDLSLKLLEQEDQINELKKELETKRGVSFHLLISSFEEFWDRIYDKCNLHVRPRRD